MSQPDEQPQAWWQTITASDLLELRRRVVEMLARRLGEGEDFEDAAQDGLLALFQNRAAVNPANQGLLRYAYVVARNRILDRRRRPRAGVLPDEGLLDPAAGSDPAESPQSADIFRFFYELDPVDRYMLWRHVVEKQSVSQVASEVGLYWHQAASRIKTALNTLRRRSEGSN